MRHRKSDTTTTLFAVIDAIQRRLEAQGLSSDVADAAIRALFEDRRRSSRRPSPA